MGRFVGNNDLNTNFQKNQDQNTNFQKNHDQNTNFQNKSSYEFQPSNNTQQR